MRDPRLVENWIGDGSKSRVDGLAARLRLAPSKRDSSRLRKDSGDLVITRTAAADGDGRQRGRDARLQVA